MEKISCVIVTMILSSFVGYSQNLEFYFMQAGIYWEGHSTSDAYYLTDGNVTCSFNASYSVDSNGIVKMFVTNPNRQGFIPAIYFIYPDNTFDLVANGYIVAKGRWSGTGRGNIPFKGRTKCSCHINGHHCTGGIDSNNDGYCDICWNHGYKCHMVNHQPK